MSTPMYGRRVHQNIKTSLTMETSMGIRKFPISSDLRFHISVNLFGLAMI